MYRDSREITRPPQSRLSCLTWVFHGNRWCSRLDQRDFPGAGVGSGVVKGVKVQIWTAYLAAHWPEIVLAVPVLAAGWTRLRTKLGVRGRYHGRHVKPRRPMKGSPLHFEPRPSRCCSCTAGRVSRHRRVCTGAAYSARPADLGSRRVTGHSWPGLAKMGRDICPQVRRQ
jgi:hypothetical protein